MIRRSIDRILRRIANSLRLIFLKASHDYVGVIGLIDYEYGYPDHPAHTKPVRREGFTPGNAILLFNTDGLEEKWSSIENAPGVEIISKPKLTTYPGNAAWVRFAFSSLSSMTPMDIS